MKDLKQPPVGPHLLARRLARSIVRAHLLKSIASNMARSLKPSSLAKFHEDPFRATTRGELASPLEMLLEHPWTTVGLANALFGSRCSNGIFIPDGDCHCQARLAISLTGWTCTLPAFTLLQRHFHGRLDFLVLSGFFFPLWPSFSSLNGPYHHH